MNKLWCLILWFNITCCNEKPCEIYNWKINSERGEVELNFINSNKPNYFNIQSNGEILTLETQDDELIIGYNEDSIQMLNFRYNSYNQEYKYLVEKYKNLYSSENDLNRFKSEIVAKIYLEHNVEKLLFKVNLLRIKTYRDIKEKCVVSKAYYTRLSKSPPYRIIEYCETKYYKNYFCELKYWFPDEAKYKNRNFIDCIFENGLLRKLAFWSTE